MAANLTLLTTSLTTIFANQIVSLENMLGELTLVVNDIDMLEVLTRLRDDPDLRFEQMIDLCGVDYCTYGSDICESGAYLKSDIAPDIYPSRFAVVYHLLSLTHNIRLRVRVFAKDDALPILNSIVSVWPCANWYEREVFDLYGIVFTDHPDLRRLLTDYGFVGNPFRKDFPLSGYVEMRYDPEQQRVIYQPVSIEPRELVPRIIREEHYGGLK